MRIPGWLWFAGCVGIAAVAGADQTEIVTYYAAPATNAKELRAEKSTVGTAYRTLDLTDKPDGSLFLAGGLIVGSERHLIAPKAETAGVYVENAAHPFGLFVRTSEITRGYGIYGASDSYIGIYGAGRDTGLYGVGQGCGVRASGTGADFYAEGEGVDYASASSIQWKRDVAPIDQPLEKVLQLRGVSFTWDADHGGRHDVGLIAEEVAEVFPEFVGTDAGGRPMSIDYGRLTAVLVEAIKAQQQRLDTQAQELERLKAKIEPLTRE